MGDDEVNTDELLSLRITVQNTRRKDVLFAFYDDNEEPITPTEISEATGMHRSNISRNLRKLEEDGLVQQIKTEGTRYRPYLLTEKGEKLRAMIDEK